MFIEIYQYLMLIIFLSIASPTDCAAPYLIKSCLNGTYNNKTVLLRDTVHQISQGESAAAGLIADGQPGGRGLPSGDLVDRITSAVRPAAADSPREIWWTVSRNYTVLFLSRYVKNKKNNQYLPADLTSLNVSNSRFRKSVMFWRWRCHGGALWRHGRGVLHNCLLLATVSNVMCWAAVANHVTWLWQAGDTENFERRITG